MSNYARYPLWMHHDGFQRAVINKSKDGTSTGLSAKFPPIMVENEEQEEYYESLGYKLGGVPNAKAYEAIIRQIEDEENGIENEEYSFQEYPKFVGERIVKSKEEELEVLKELNLTSEVAGEIKKKPGRSKKHGDINSTSNNILSSSKAG